MSLFPRRFIKLPLDCDRGYFYMLGNKHVLLFSDFALGTTLFETPWNIQCMFQICNLVDGDSDLVGLSFSSQFTVVNKGGYLMTYMNKVVSLAEIDESHVLVRTPNVVIASFPGKGALAISPKVSDDVQEAFDEQ